MGDWQQPTAAAVAGPAGPDYNYRSLPPSIFLKDLQLTLRGGPAPGNLAPDFALESAAGQTVRLRDLRGRPVVLIFGSVT